MIRVVQAHFRVALCATILISTAISGTSAKPVETWTLEYKPYWFDTIKMLKEPLLEIFEIMNDFYIDGEYCPVSEDDDILGTGQSLERYEETLRRALIIHNQTLPYIAQNGNESQFNTWTEVGDVLSSYAKLIEQFYPSINSAISWLARMPSHNYLGSINVGIKEDILLCIIVDCRYFDKDENPLMQTEVDARSIVEFDDDAQQRFVDDIQLIRDKLELHENIINGLVDWEEGLDASSFDGFKVLFSESNGSKRALKSVVQALDAWIGCRAPTILSLWDSLKAFPNVVNIVEEMSRDF
ncbi:hypothetical protein TWF730_003829 [Orbilia blumenaviensis]|uniref:Uncharacterized protein n=1 Tax=Orbilia blumenaviensis TaxID=1796055 RepID=A0AAV9U0T4_9PEZI